jgi:hypothetical protein
MKKKRGKTEVVKKLRIRKGIFLLVFIVIVFGLIGVVYSLQGATWTTKDCVHGAGANDVYKPGETLFIYAKNFDPGTYHWSIRGQPGSGSCNPNQIVAEGDYLFTKVGEVCFNAYTIKNRECGEYKVDFGSKSNNYKVDKNFCALEVYGTVYLNSLGGIPQANFPLLIICRHGDTPKTLDRIKTDSSGNFSVNFLEGDCAEGDTIELSGWSYGSNLGAATTGTMVCNTQINLVVSKFN